MENTQSKIIDSTLEVIGIKGLQKVTLNDIAIQAGVSRPTVYSYFKDKDEAVQFALLHSAYAIVYDIIKHVEKFDSRDERLIEAMMYCLNRIPKESHLGILTDPSVVYLVNEFGLVSKEGNEICQNIFKVVLMGQYQDEQDLNEIIEFCVRLLLSLLTMKSLKKRNNKQQREFLRKRMLPALES